MLKKRQAMLSLNSLHGTFCQNKLKKQWLEPTSWFIRKSRCIRLSEMNGLVVRTMGFTGCARLNSNKDANNRSRSCGQGCESPPFTGEGTQLQVQKRQQPKAFQVASLPDSSDDSVLTAHGPLQRTANKPKQTKKCQSSPALCIQSNNHLPSHLLLPQIFPKRSGYSAGFSPPQSL